VGEAIEMRTEQFLPGPVVVTVESNMLRFSPLHEAWGSPWAVLYTEFVGMAAAPGCERDFCFVCFILKVEEKCFESCCLSLAA
jgi:hypothetical protein